MSSLRERLSNDMKDAMKAGDKVRLSTIRMLLSAIKNREIDQKVKLGDDAVLESIVSQVKQRKDSIEQFVKAGRTDLSEKEQAELDILYSYLPSQLTDEQLDIEIENVISECGAKDAKDLGRVMKLIMARVSGRADGKVLSDKVRKRLAG